MRRTANLRVEGRLVADDLSPFQTLVVKAGNAETSGRVQLIAWAFVTIAYAICDLADAVRSTAPPLIVSGPSAPGPDAPTHGKAGRR